MDPERHLDYSKKAGLKPFILFITAFYIAHVAYTYVYAETSYLQGYLLPQIALRLGLWTLPTLVYLAVTRVNPFVYLKLEKNVLKGIVWGVLIGACILGLNILRVYAFTGRIGLNLNISRDFWWRGIILVGLSEEVVFRGFILQKINERAGFWTANSISGVLFVIVHIIGWVILNQFDFPAKAMDMAVLFIFSLLQGFVLKKTKSLWACMIVHSFNNFTSAVL